MGQKKVMLETTQREGYVTRIAPHSNPNLFQVNRRFPAVVLSAMSARFMEHGTFSAACTKKSTVQPEVSWAMLPKSSIWQSTECECHIGKSFML